MPKLYQAAIDRLLTSIAKATPGDSAQGLNALCEGVLRLESAAIYAAAREGQNGLTVELEHIQGGSGGMVN